MEEENPKSQNKLKKQGQSKKKMPTLKPDTNHYEFSQMEEDKTEEIIDSSKFLS